ncbi:MAG: hypothetical protein WB661_02795 [Candidatus Bathyarchaeia archaeon]
MFRERIFEWSRNFGRILDAGNKLNALAVARRGLLPSTRSIVWADIDISSVEMTREVSRAYMSPIQGNR